jgi:hypothetical protein
MPMIRKAPQRVGKAASAIFFTLANCFEFSDAMVLFYGWAWGGVGWEAPLLAATPLTLGAQGD